MDDGRKEEPKEGETVGLREEKNNGKIKTEEAKRYTKGGPEMRERKETKKTTQKTPARRKKRREKKTEERKSESKVLHDEDKETPINFTSEKQRMNESAK